MRKFVAIGLVMLGVAAAGCASYEVYEAEHAATVAARAWLALVDSGKYAESWEQSAEYFQNAISKEEWEQKLHGFREPLGKVLSRKLKIRRHETSLPGAPDGEYVVIYFGVAFDNKAVALEQITPMREKDGEWRVAGYRVR